MPKPKRTKRATATRWDKSHRYLWTRQSQQWIFDGRGVAFAGPPESYWVPRNVSPNTKIYAPIPRRSAEDSIYWTSKPWEYSFYFWILMRLTGKYGVVWARANRASVFYSFHVRISYVCIRCVWRALHTHSSRVFEGANFCVAYGSFRAPFAHRTWTESHTKGNMGALHIIIIQMQTCIYVQYGTQWIHLYMCDRLVIRNNKSLMTWRQYA